MRGLATEQHVGERIEKYEIDIKTYIIHVNGPIKSGNFSIIFKK